jgi:hypothetical protein
MARRIYSTIVARDGTPAAKPSDPADLAEAMRVLGITADALAADLAAWREVAALRAAADADADALAAALAERQQQRERRNAEMVERRRDLMAEFRAAVQTENELRAEGEADARDTRAQLTAISSARGRIDELRRRHPLAFAAE